MELHPICIGVFVHDCSDRACHERRTMSIGLLTAPVIRCDNRQLLLPVHLYPVQCTTTHTVVFGNVAKWRSETRSAASCNILPKQYHPLPILTFNRWLSACTLRLCFSYHHTMGASRRMGIMADNSPDVRGYSY